MYLSGKVIFYVPFNRFVYRKINRRGHEEK
jgi:hypothetical protein